MMGIVKISDGLHEEIRKSSNIMSRSINSQAEFCGFDTFTGMPENWMHMKAGHYDKIGQAPVSNDSRVKFFKSVLYTVSDNLRLLSIPPS